MEKQIPIYFDSVVVSSPIEPISDSNPNLGRLKVRVFTKYGNRNGSYITDNVAEQLIQSATNGNVPVIGFFDPNSNSWASHTGPKLANGYGYVESFLGWEPFTDTDGITRDYAVFSVILFTKYFEEAQKILGENQSMELNPDFIDGEWAIIEDQEYFVYTKAEILGLCVIGQHEPCFSVSAFFSKKDDEYTSQYEKFSSLLSDLKTQVEEAEKNNEGGEHQMEGFENQEAVENKDFQVDEPEVVETEQGIEPAAGNAFEVNETVEKVAVEEPVTEEFAAEENVLQQQFDELQNNFNELTTKYNNLETEFNTFRDTSNTTIETLRAENSQLQSSLQQYEAQAAQVLEEKKNDLIDKYSELVTAEEIEQVRANIKNFSYEEIESKLAISFANKQISDSKAKMVPLPEHQESSFASLMKNYKK